MSNKVSLQARIDESLDIKLRELAAKHRKRPNVILDFALEHCFSNRHFLSKLEEALTKKEEEVITKITDTGYEVNSPSWISGDRPFTFDEIVKA